MRCNKIILGLGFAVILLLGGCSTPQRVSVQDTMSEISSGVPSTNNLRITLLKAPSKNVYVNMTVPLKRKHPTLTQWMAPQYSQSAQAVFEVIGSVSEKLRSRCYSGEELDLFGF